MIRLRECVNASVAREGSNNMTQREVAVPFDSGSRWLLQRGLPTALATSAVIALTTYALCSVTASWLL